MPLQYIYEQAAARGELEKIQRRVRQGWINASRQIVQRTSTTLHRSYRRLTRQAGLGTKVAKSWRLRHYNEDRRGRPIPKSLVYSKAPRIIRGMEKGGVTKPISGRYLAIPFDPNQKGRGTRSVRGKLRGINVRPTPQNLESRFGPFTPIRSKDGRLFLISEGLRVATSRKTGKQTFKRAGPRTRSGQVTGLMFRLVRRRFQPKRISRAGARQRGRQQMRRLVEGLGVSRG